MRKIWIIILFFSSATSLLAQGRLIGRIVAEDGSPVPGATVSVSGQTAMVAITNAQGYYVMLDVPKGNYEVKAAKRGKPTWSGSLSVLGATTQRVDIKLGGNSENIVAAKQRDDARKAQLERLRQQTLKTKQESDSPQPEPPPAPVVEPTVVADAKDIAKEQDLQKAIEESEKLNQLDVAQGELPEKDVEIVGGIEAVQSKIEYPLAVKRAKIDGTVVARVFIGEDGNVLRISLVQPANKFLNEEVIRVLTEETTFKPAKVGNVAVRGAITIPVKFQIR